MELVFHEVDKSVLILSADGGLNADTSAEFVEQLEKLVDGGVTQIIVDCTRLEYISSYGIGDDMFGLVEEELNREGLTMGVLAHPPKLTTFATMGQRKAA